MLKTVITTTLLGLVFVACSSPAASPISDESPTSPKSKSGEVDDDDGDCSSGPGSGSSSSSSLEPTDPSTLPKCACDEGGAARCVPKGGISASFASKLESCDGGGGLCVPDKLVASGGAAPKTCESIVGDGRCMSLCVPEVAAKKDLLDRGKGDVCDDNELCVPCNNPLEGNKPTGVCEIGKKATSAKKCPEKKTPSTSSVPSSSDSEAACPYKGEPINVTIFPACGAGGRCVPASAVSASQQSRLNTCDGGLCAPEKSVAAKGQHLPATCRAVGDVEGRCLSTVIKDIAAKASSLEKGACDANELCAPCFNPIDGTSTGACSSVSCDAPKEKAKSFASCCGGKAKCVPEGSVSADQKEKLGVKECVEDVELCAPTEDINRTTKRPTCNGTMKFPPGKAYVGACVSTCLELGLKGKFIEQGSCDGEHTCAPCVDPFGKNTGACD